MQSEPSTQTITAYFAEYSMAEKAISDLRALGVKQEQIRCVMRPSYEPSASTNKLEGSNGVWRGLVRFFKTEAAFDPYSKEHHGSDSYRVAGQPCHGGYAMESSSGPLGEQHLPDAQTDYFARRFSEGKQNAILSVTVGDLQIQARSILQASRGDLGNAA